MKGKESGWQARITDDEIVSTAISTDGTSQRCGFSPKNSVVTIIANTTGKFIIVPKQKHAKHVPIGEAKLTNFKKYINVYSTILHLRGRWSLMEFWNVLYHQ